MATVTITHLYDNHDDSAQAVRDLKAAGVTAEEMSLVTRQSEGEDGGSVLSKAGEGAGAGASLGAILGAGAGLLAGFGILAIPGIGPVIAAGWLVATAAGAATGAAAVGILGLLIGAGMSEEQANIYAEGVKRGGTLISVRVDEARATEVEDIMRRNRPVDTTDMKETLRAGGWQASEAGASPPAL